MQGRLMVSVTSSFHCLVSGILEVSEGTVKEPRHALQAFTALLLVLSLAVDGLKEGPPGGGLTEDHLSAILDASLRACTVAGKGIVRMGLFNAE